MIASQKVLSDLALECIRTRFSDSNEAPKLNAEGFRRILNPINWPIVSNEGVIPRTEPDATPLHLEIPDDLYSVQTLQFLGFQRANAKEIFADYTSPKNEKRDRPLGLVELAKLYINVAERVAESISGTEEQPVDDIRKVVFLTQVCMGLDLNGDRLQIIDQPERPLVWSTVKDWVIEVLERRYKFLCKLDSAIVGMEMAYRRLEEDEATRKARNRKKAEAKKAAKQRRKALKVGEAEAVEERAEGDNQGRSHDQVIAKNTEERGGAQASNNSEEAENPPRISSN